MEYLKGKRPLGIPRHRREDNININLKEIKCETELNSFGSDRIL
jgi:hypothetical protein